MIGPGDKVVCVDDVTRTGRYWPLKKGAIYTVWQVVTPARPARFPHRHPNETSLRLFECPNPLDRTYGSYAETRFRKLDIEQFRDMAKSADTLPVTERKARKVTA